eukprot:186763-Amphidinium_carterae.1
MHSSEFVALEGGVGKSLANTPRAQCLAQLYQEDWDAPVVDFEFLDSIVTRVASVTVLETLCPMSLKESVQHMQHAQSSSQSPEELYLREHTT